MTMALEIKAVFVFGFALLSLGAEATSRRGLVGAAGGAVFDVTKYGAKPDGKLDSTLSIIRAWRAACDSTGSPATLVIPPGTYMTNEVILGGPCTAPKPITIEIQGTLLAKSDISMYSSGNWITIEHVDGVVVKGPGTLNGQGETAWKYKDEGSSTMLPNSLVFERANNSAISGVTFINSMGFHMKVSDCTGFTVDNLNITAPGTSPNTDGIHISGSTNVNVTNTVIATGDDCISIGDSNNNISISQITCGPGHGISIGSLGKRSNEESVHGVTVRNCTLTGTTNGARIKTYRQSPKLEATDIIFEDIVMNGVKNPVVIDQNYASKKRPGGSNVKISNVHFKNIRGTTISPIAVDLSCSDVVPCEGVELVDVDLSLTSNTPLVGQVVNAIAGGFKSNCANVKAAFSGKQNPPACA